MYKLICKKDGKNKLIAMFDTKIEAIYEHIKYKRQDRVFLVEAKQQ